MKFFYILLIILFIPLIAKAERYQVEIFDHTNYFEIQIRSSKNYGSPRYLKPIELYIEAPEESLSGVISMNIQQDPKILPLSEPGQDIGCLEFRKGICLPKIDIGEYQLIIDDEYYGIIYVSNNKTYLSRFFEVNYNMY